MDDITPELIAILKNGGCKVMSFGLESADNRVLKSMRKGTTVEQIERTLKLVYDSGISFEGAFIFGDIAETRETADNTLKWWHAHSECRRRREMSWNRRNKISGTKLASLKIVASLEVVS